MELSKLDVAEVLLRGTSIAQNCLDKWSLLLYRESDSPNSPLLLAYPSTPEAILTHWRSVVADVALYVQAELRSELRRNLSLFFLAQGAVDRKVVKAIREDTYCCKKIVIEAASPDVLFELRRYYLVGRIESLDKADTTNDMVGGEILSDFIYKEFPEVKPIMAKVSRV